MRGTPPPRYRVTEQGRRLMVVDSWAEHGRPRPGSDAPAAPAGWFRRTRFDGGGELVTAGWYDDAGPRVIRLDPGSVLTLKLAAGGGVVALAATALLAPWLLVPLTIGAIQARRSVRGFATRWLDRVAREAS